MPYSITAVELIGPPRHPFSDVNHQLSDMDNSIAPMVNDSHNRPCDPLMGVNALSCSCIGTVKPQKADTQVQYYVPRISVQMLATEQTLLPHVQAGRHEGHQC